MFGRGEKWKEGKESKEKWKEGKHFLCLVWEEKVEGRKNGGKSFPFYSINCIPPKMGGKVEGKMIILLKLQLYPY